MILKSELRPLRGQIRVMFEEGLSTADMAKALQVPESTVERELHAVLEIKRAIVGLKDEK